MVSRPDAGQRYAARRVNSGPLAHATPTHRFAGSEANVYNVAVDFAIVLKTLISELDRLQIRYATIGGFALGVLGAPRQTIDLDFLVHQDDLDKLHAVLATLGYQRVFSTENVSQYCHQDKAWGSIDLIHAFREISLGMLGRAKSYPLSGGSQTVKAAEPGRCDRAEG